jgi:hypothetical protein
MSRPFRIVDIKLQGAEQKLIDLKSDMLCEGHFGIYQPASEVKDYIESYLSQLKKMA